MIIENKKVTNIKIGTDSVVKITDQTGIVLWKKKIEPIVTTATPMYFENVDSVPVEISIYAGDKFQHAVTLETSTDGDVWELWGTTYEEGSLVRQVQLGEKLYIRATENVGSFNTIDMDNLFKSTGNVNVGGNIMSLIYKDYKDKTILTTTHTFFHLFYNMSALLSAKDLLLPATTLTENCYLGMFDACTSLTEAPELPADKLATYCYTTMFQGCTSLTKTPSTLPATQLANYCYQYMFRGCSSLTTAPELPATTLTTYCYASMFQGCTSLTKAPSLPANTLATYCYQYMFRGCSSLTTAPELPATTLATYCYQYMFRDCTSLTEAPELPATKLVGRCYQYMFQGCSSLTKAPSTLPATTLANRCYQYMFQGCKTLTTAPVLPATTLTDYCCQNMFYGCTSLNKVVTYATDISATDCLTNWLYDVSAVGDFYNLGTATYPSGASGIPSGWTEHTSLD